MVNSAPTRQSGLGPHTKVAWDCLFFYSKEDHLDLSAICKNLLFPSGLVIRLDSGESKASEPPVSPAYPCYLGSVRFDSRASMYGPGLPSLQLFMKYVSHAKNNGIPEHFSLPEISIPTDGAIGWLHVER